MEQTNIYGGRYKIANNPKKLSMFKPEKKGNQNINPINQIYSIVHISAVDFLLFGYFNVQKNRKSV